MILIGAWLTGAAGLGAVSFSLGRPRLDGRRSSACGAMLAVAVIDCRHQIIPDPLNALAFIAGLIAALLGRDSRAGALWMR